MKRIYIILIVLVGFFVSCSSDYDSSPGDGIKIDGVSVSPRSDSVYAIDEMIYLDCDDVFYYNPVLAEKLGFVVLNLKNNRFNYDWYEQSSCNVGCVSRILLDKFSDASFKALTDPYYLPLKDVDKIKAVSPEGVTWSYMTNYYCPVGDMYLPDIFYVLSKVGLRPEDIVDLEYLRNPCILRGSGIDVGVDGYERDPKNLVLYLESWIKILNDDSLPIYKNPYKRKVQKKVLRKVREGEIGQEAQGVI